MDVQQQLRDIAHKLLTEQTVDVILGFKNGTLPLRTTPCVISNPEDADQLVWNATCENNLTKYLMEQRGTIGVTAKGCDARAIVACILENQIDRENVYIIGLPCSGVLDRKKVETTLNGKEVQEATVNGHQIILKGAGFELTFPVKDYLDDTCQSCQHRNPPIYDVLVGDPVPEQMSDAEHLSASRHDAESVEERWEYFTKELSKCIRCYACKNVCPLCYCQECFVDQNMPTWLGKTNALSDVVVYHIVRVFHMAGRCVDCGACSRACPVGIDLRELTQKMVQLVKDEYGFEAGLSLDVLPPLTTFQQDDAEEFIK
jgi:coenzyme F420-reducing hydrogenase beta subunit